MLLIIVFNKIQEYCIYLFLIILNSEFSYIEVLFTDQNSNTLEIEDKISITLVIN